MVLEYRQADGRFDAYVYRQADGRFDAYGLAEDGGAGRRNGISGESAIGFVPMALTVL